MTQKEKTLTTTGNDSQELASNERKNIMIQLEIPLLIYILKKCSTKAKPLYASDIAQYMSLITGEKHTAKNIQRKLQKICLLQNDNEEEIVNNTLFLTFGGCVVEVTNENTPNIQKIQTRYYFRPLLDAGDVALICGAITSNRYLTPQEKKYLLSREQTLTLCNDTEENIEKIKGYFTPQLLPDKPASAAKQPSIKKNSVTSAPAKQASSLLHLVNRLHDAIENKYQLQIIYGIYDADPDSFKHIRFRARNADKPYNINPYALLWSNGAYYLLATHDGHDNPVHFRVDRIMTARPRALETDATQKQPRAGLPESLKPYFSMDGTAFDVVKYTATYPLMGIYDAADTQNCFIECTATTLSILIDHFGTGINIQPSPLPHNKEEVDFHGKPQQFFAVQIKQVQYDNILQLCLQQHSSITALHPRRLVEDVQRGLTLSLQKYREVTDKLDPVQPLQRKEPTTE